jgi:hypothetical protein
MLPDPTLKQTSHITNIPIGIGDAGSKWADAAHAPKGLFPWVRRGETTVS